MLICDYVILVIHILFCFESVKSTENVNRRNLQKLIFKNNASFRSCISKINNLFVDNTEDLDIVMPMYNLLEYSDNYSMTYRDEVNHDANEITTKQQ